MPLKAQMALQTGSFEGNLEGKVNKSVTVRPQLEICRYHEGLYK